MPRNITIRDAAATTGLLRSAVASRRAELNLGRLVDGPSPYWLLSAAEVRKIANCRPAGYRMGRPKGAKNKSQK